jgi:hypothetical protein
MALSSIYETWVRKQAQINKKQLEKEDLVSQLNLTLAPLQAQIESERNTYQNQIAVLNADIQQLETDIKELVIS